MAVERIYFDRIKLLETRIKKLIKEAKNYPYDQTDMKTVIENLEALLTVEVERN